jgi:hypothetical protein
VRLQNDRYFGSITHRHFFPSEIIVEKDYVEISLMKSLQKEPDVLSCQIERVEEVGSLFGPLLAKI